MNVNALDGLESSAYRTVMDHGFFDLLLGAALTVVTLALVWSPWIALVLIALVIAKRPMLAHVNHRILEPRVGHVRLSPVRLEQISTARKAAALSFFGLGLVVARLDEMGAPTGAPVPLAWLGEHAQVQMAIIAGIAVAVAGWLFRLPRFMAYAMVVFLIPLATAGAGLPAGTGWAIATLLVLTAGTVVLGRFLRRNPVDR